MRVDTGYTEMPKLIPIPILTKHKFILIRIWRWITSIRKWEVLEDWTYKLRDGTIIVIPKEFKFDGASIPRPLWGLLSPVGLLLIPGLVHDFAYKYNCLIMLDSTGKRSLYNFNAGRAHWDKVFRQTGVDVNGIALIDILAWIALFIGGWWPWWRHRKRNESPDIFL